jgi:hypothetical protein
MADVTRTPMSSCLFLRANQSRKYCACPGTGPPLRGIPCRNRHARRTTTAAMTAAFEHALTPLNVADREAHIATLVAKKIVRLAKRGERNPTRLTEGVIQQFRDNPIPAVP